MAESCTVFFLPLMSTIRISKRQKFTTVSNELLNNEKLSLRAKGLMCYLLSKPDDWEVNVKHLATTCKEGRDAIYKVIDELLEEGYMTREQLKDKGRFLGYDYTVLERAVKPEPDKTLPEKPDTVDSTLLNTEVLNTEVVNTPGAKSSSEKKEVTMTQRKINFLKLVIDYATDNPSKHPKLMYVEFAKYWVESSMHKKKVILRFEAQDFFDIGRRLSTWLQKVNDVTLHGYWDSEAKVETLNALFKKQILNINDTKEGQ